MATSRQKKTSRRTFLKGVAATAAAGAGVWLGGCNRVSRAAGKKIIIIGIDGMDPRLSRSMMNEGLLPNLKKLSESGGFSDLATSMPPQSPVAWASFINGAGPGSHGIFDFVHRKPHEKLAMSYSASETTEPEGGLVIGDHNLQLDFWPFNHKPPKPVLLRQGVPFWDYLDKAGVPTTFYDLPSNYPASPSTHGHHRCICGMGTPDMMGSLGGTYQYFVENVPEDQVEEWAGQSTRTTHGGMWTRLTFDNETAQVQTDKGPERPKVVGPPNTLRVTPPSGRHSSASVDFKIHRDRSANAAVLEIQGKRIVLRPGQWSRWTQLDFNLTAPWYLPNNNAEISRHPTSPTGETVTGICRFYLQEVAPNFRLYVTPVNINPAKPALPISEPSSFIEEVAGKLGPFYTTGFQEDHQARTEGVFNDDEFIKQATLVLEERLKLLEYAIKNYDDGLLFFYFSSSDLQSHMLWWDPTPDEEHPSRTEPGEAARLHQHVRSLYRKLDEKIGELHQQYGAHATIIVMSDHGFGNFGWQFNVNCWLRDTRSPRDGNNYMNPGANDSILRDDFEWSETKAYGLGLNGLYLNLRGREPHGIVEPGAPAEALMAELIAGLEAFEYPEGRKVIRKVYRAKDIYGEGGATALAPDLIVGYSRGYRGSWDGSGGGLRGEAISKNERPWSADHCVDALEVPGVLWCNHTIKGRNPSLVDLAPSILAAYGLNKPASMTGENVLDA